MKKPRTKAKGTVSAKDEPSNRDIGSRNGVTSFTTV